MGAQLVIPLSPSGGLHYYTIGGWVDKRKLLKEIISAQWSLLR